MITNMSYQELKEYQLFKDLGILYDPLELKEILPLFVKRVLIDKNKQDQFKNNFIYVSENYINALIHPQMINVLLDQKEAIILEQSSKTKNQNTFLAIEKKAYIIFKFIFHKKIKCMQNMKKIDKLNLLYHSDLLNKPFGTYVYRKHDDITHIYYIVKGNIQISNTINQKEIIIASLHEDTFFGIYQFGKNKIRRILNAQSISNDSIILSIKLDLLTQFFGKDPNQIIDQLFTLKSEINRIKKGQIKKQLIKDWKKSNINFIKPFEFNLRMKRFQNETKLDKKNQAFKKYIENKRFIFHIKDSNEKFQKQQKQSLPLFKKFSNDQSMTKYSDRLNQHRMFTIGPFLPKQQKIKNIDTNLQIKERTEILTSRLKKRFDTSFKSSSIKGFELIKTFRS